MKITNFEKLAARRGRSREQYLEEFQRVHGRDRTPPEYDSTTMKGWHLYINVKIVPKFWAPRDEQSSQRSLRFINAYAQIAQRVAKQFGAQVLEVQGKRIHFFLEKEIEDDTQIIALADALINVLYKSLKTFDAEVFRGLAAAADFGPTVGVNTIGSDSIISLGPAACSPAKRLNSTRSGHLMHRIALSNKWREIELLDRSIGGGYSSSQQDIIGGLMAEIEQAIPGYQAASFEIRTNVAGSFYYESKGFNPFEQATLIQGFFARADLDGFTAQIADAFDADNPDETIATLVTSFKETTNDVDRLLRNFGSNRVVQLNWAGDCANFIVLPELNEDFQDSRTYLPTIVGAQWHDEMSDDDRKWVLGIAGDDDANGASTDGTILLATIQLGSLKFRISAGWSVGNSLKAQEAAGSRNGDTVLHEKDHKHLNDVHCKGFTRLAGTEFYCAHKLSMAGIQAVCAAGASYTSTPEFSPKPYSLGDS
jgi:hypothetical protein